MEKPNGQLVVGFREESVVQFAQKLNVRKVETFTNSAANRIKVFSDRRHWQRSRAASECNWCKHLWGLVREESRDQIAIQQHQLRVLHGG